MKKYYTQPELMVVLLKDNDLIITSGEETIAVRGTTDTYLAPDRFGDWDAGY